jgi:hypothetical protein
MSLLDLSIELLQQVIYDAIPEGFESLALSCKCLHAASQLYIKKYNKWNHYACKKDGEYISSPLKVLLEIAVDPDIPRYIQHADFSSEPHHPSLYQLNGSILVELKRCRDRVGMLLDRSIVLRNTVEDSTIWLPRVLEGICGHHFAISVILSLLYNLKGLQLPNSWGSDPWIHAFPEDQMNDIVRAIVQDANDASKPLAGLSKLAVFNPLCGTSTLLRRDLRNLPPFLELNSLRTLRCGSIVIYPTAQEPLPMTFLTTVEMAGCSVEADGISFFLKSTPRLRKFRFSWEEKFAFSKSSWDAGAFVAAIADAVGNTLEEMSLSILDLCGSGVNPIASMTNFTQLKTLELDIRLLLGVGIKFGGRLEPQRVRIPLELRQILPPSISTFHFLMNDSTECSDCLAALATGFYSELQSKRRKLSRIKIHCAVLSKKDDIIGNSGVYVSPAESSRRLEQLADAFNSFSVYFREEHVSIYQGFPCAGFMPGFWKLQTQDDAP